MQPAVPHYIAKTFGSTVASPGQRFRIYFSGWDSNWKLEDAKKRDALEKVVTLSVSDARLLNALRDRQLRLACGYGDRALIDLAVSEAPFVTGMGMEHPLENGFSFLDPYGLPYLPGSSVKGVMRKAAEELALFEGQSSGWSLLDVWWLFGFDETSAFFSKDTKIEHQPTLISDERKRWREAYNKAAEQHDQKELGHFVSLVLPDDEDAKQYKNNPLAFLRALPDSTQLQRKIHLRGSLCFWDVLPYPPDRRMRVDIMNPHFSDYYQRGGPPGDWGNPTPIFFLSMAAGTAFRFIMHLKPVHALPPRLKEGWNSLMRAALHHAFSWLGFGAKTSLGYGLMRQDHDGDRHASELDEEKRAQRDTAARPEKREGERGKAGSLSSLDKMIFRLETDANEQEVNEVFQKHLDACPEADRLRLAKALRKACVRLGKWSGNQSKKQKAKIARLKQILGER